MQPLDDIVVLDLTHHVVGPYATKLMADYGADVIKVEAPSGDIARHLGPFKDDVPGPERSGLFFLLNTNKRSVVLDLTAPEAPAVLRTLAQRAHIVVENFAPGFLDGLGIGWEFFHAIKPELSLISISNFGQNGPYRDFQVSELVLYGFAGEMYSMGVTTREPVKMAGTAALFESGAATAPAIMGSLFASKRFGIGQHVDISLAETHFGGVDRRHAAAIGNRYSGGHSGRGTGAAAGMPNGIYPCADGYVEFNAASARPDRVADMLGNPDWVLDPKYADPMAAANPDLVEEWNANFLAWCIERTKREVWAEARRAKVLCGPLFTTEDLFDDDHFRGRGFWATAETEELGKVEIPGRPFIMERGGWELRHSAPRLGQHTAEVLAEVGIDARTVAAIGGS